MGIAILIHHNHGSRSLIDTVHSYGSCVSYEELMRFLTSVAENERHVQNRIYIPSSMDITTVDCSLVQEGDDNVDIVKQLMERIHYM